MQVANILGISLSSVYRYLRKFGIETRDSRKGFLGHTHTEATREKISKARKIPGMGHKKKSLDGYIMVYFPGHPKSSKIGYIMEHILKMEKLIGRHLKDDEVVHHINGVKTDNRYGNLMLMKREEHSRYHMKKRRATEQNNKCLGQQS